MDLSERKKVILKAIVDEFVKTAIPVGSKTLISNYGISCSSATIRSECSQLEKMGLLEKSHTSSGRIPSTIGYRYYVDHLMNTKVENSFNYQIEKVFNSRDASVKQVLKKASELLSDVTKLVTVINSNSDDEVLKKIDFIELTKTSAVVIMVTDAGTIQNKTFDLSNFINIDDLKWCIKLLNERLAGTNVNELIDKLDSLRPIMQEQITHYEKMFQKFISAFMQFGDQGDTFTAGTDNITMHPEFQNPEKIKQIMKMLNDHSSFKQMSLMDKNILIGEETGIASDFTVFKGNYDINGKKGTISLIGPKRSDYETVKKAIDNVVDNMTSYFKKGVNEDE